jgi:hypothetical protein
MNYEGPLLALATFSSFSLSLSLERRQEKGKKRKKHRSIPNEIPQLTIQLRSVAPTRRGSTVTVLARRVRVFVREDWDSWIMELRCVVFQMCLFVVSSLSLSLGG